MVIQYKCPKCGSDMSYDPNTRKLTCSSCGHTADIEKFPLPEKAPETDEVEEFRPDDISEENPIHFEKEYDTAQNHFQGDEAREYLCNNCGAVIITDADTAATTCSFCGAPVILGDRLSGSLAPAKIIPFKITKEQAQEGFKKWCRGGRFTPRDFRMANRIKSIQGIYVPFWLYDVNSVGDADATCTRVRTFRRGDYDYTETSYYHVYRRVNLNYENIPADASAKMNDAMMDKLEPYRYDELTRFNMPYLAGYLAEKYNDTDEELFPRVKDRAERYTDEYIRGSISGYTTVHINRKNIDSRSLHSDYVLLPVWMVCYDYNKAEHTFAMNGQTGKIVGKPPISAGKVAAWFFGVSGAVFLLQKLISVLLGGPLL